MRNSKVSRLLFLSAVFSIFALPARAASGVSEPSADVVLCEASDLNSFSGYLSVDFLLSFADNLSGLAPVSTLDVSLDRITRVLTEKVPTLVPSLQEFRSLARNLTDFTKARVWEEMASVSQDIADADVLARLPANCRSGAQPQKIRVILRSFDSGVRRLNGGGLTYRFVPSLLNQLERQAPLQLSFLYVQLWLLDHSLDPVRNRRINEFFHSRRIESMSATEVQAQLRAQGFFIPEQQPELFDPRSCQGPPLTMQDINTRYTRANSTVRLSDAQVTIARRRHTVDCDGAPRCDVSLHADRFTPEAFTNFPYYPFLWWQENHREAPFKIFSIRERESHGSPYLPHPDNAQFSCRPTGNPDPQKSWECDVSLDLVRSFGGRLADDEHFVRIEGDPPKLVGIVTQECFRFQNSYLGNDSVVIEAGSFGHHEPIDQFETVLFGRMGF